MIGRALATITELGADLQPDGWRVTGSPGVDQRRARSLLAQDLDALEGQTQEYAGLLKVQVTGPWTLAANVEVPKGDRVLRDYGARRDLGEALAEGIAAHLSDVRRRVPGAELLLQLDEPSLPDVLAGRVPTASGFHRHRSVDPQEAGSTLQRVVDLATASGADTVVHCCAVEPPLTLIRSAGAAGVSVDLDRLGPGDLDTVAELLEAGQLGLPRCRPHHPPGGPAHRHAGHPAAAATARHARPRARRATRGHAGLRPGGRRPGSGRARPWRSAGRRARNLTGAR